MHQIQNQNKAPQVRTSYKGQIRKQLFMPCRREVKEKAVLDGIQVSNLAGTFFSQRIPGSIQTIFFEQI